MQMHAGDEQALGSRHIEDVATGGFGHGGIGVDEHRHRRWGDVYLEHVDGVAPDLEAFAGGLDQEV